MVQLGQLKPNNLLTDPAKDNQLVKVIRININDGNDGQVHEVDPNYVYSYKVDLRTLDPIPLSPEWLEKCGFELFLTHPSSRHITYNKTEIILFAEGNGYRLGHYKHCRIEYLHQLQNLYYALTGTELVIDQKKNG